MESKKKKTGWWGIAGIIGLIFLGISAFSGSDTTPQPSNTISSPSVYEAKPTTNPTPTNSLDNSGYSVQKSSPPSNLSNNNYYTNVDGNQVHSPAYSTNGSIPSGASARCRDGTYSFSQNRRGTCSHHGGVATRY